jgi:KUP system potassium uptake protein
MSRSAQHSQAAKMPPGDQRWTAVSEHRDEPRGGRLTTLSLAALGIVYGDIGTSPLYALRECFHGEHAVRATAANVLGVLSLIFWALLIVISIKYLTVIMRADNAGEGGILALLAFLIPGLRSARAHRQALIALGIFGAALLYGDGLITPAISVLSAVEGLQAAQPQLGPWVVPLTMAILVLLFVFQQRGTARVGALFGPLMLGWFALLAVLGIRGIAHAPSVLAAIHPLHAMAFFAANGRAGFLILGAVFLVVTGGEALYADMGHFGRRPIRLAWFSIVLPSLLLNYFGQGALVLTDSRESLHPFYHLAPGWATYPLITLATLATIIASQAVISGAFSLTRQAILLGLWPRMNIVQTSSDEIGQIYIPAMNWALMAGTIGLVIGFGSSSRLAAAYGVAVATTMVITTILVFRVTTQRWRWPLPLAVLACGGLLVIDLSFLGANMLKVADGGWFPLLVGAVVYTIMATWQRGRQILAEHLERNVEPMAEFLARIEREPPVRVPGTAIFLSGRISGMPPMLPHHLERNQVLHERVILLTSVIEEVPRVAASARLDVEPLAQGFHRMVVHYGFMQSPNIPVALRLCEHLGFAIDLDRVTYYIGRETVIPTHEVEGMAVWRERLFAFLSRNASRATAFFALPSDRVVEIGLEVKL